MVKNGNGGKSLEILWWLQFSKANTYVFAAPIIRDREVGGSNPLAPTSFPKGLGHRDGGLSICAVFCAETTMMSTSVTTIDCEA